MSLIQFRITYDYTTGDTFNTYTSTGQIPHLFDSSDLAVKARDVIYKHARDYDLIYTSSYKEKYEGDPKLFNDTEVTLEVEPNIYKDFYVSYNGYFERLEEVRIEAILDGKHKLHTTFLE